MMDFASKIKINEGIAEYYKRFWCDLWM